MSSKAVQEVNSAFPAPPKPITTALPGLLQRKCACAGSSGLTREYEECGQKRMAVQRMETGRSESSTIPSFVHEVPGSPGQPLDHATRSFMEPLFGHDFGRVRVHADAHASESASAVNALAYTVGEHIVFGAGRYAPATLPGQQLLAHELTHTIQQASDATSNRLGSLQVAAPDDAHEREADAIAAAVGRGPRQVQASHSGPGRRAVVQRATVPAAESIPDLPVQPAKLPRCGPDVTGWFVDQVNTALTDPDVLDIKRNLARANSLALAFGATANQFAEAGVTARVLLEEISLGSRAPIRNATINTQLASGSASMGAVAAALPHGLAPPRTIPIPFISPSMAAALRLMMAFFLNEAARVWKSLVTHGGRYDFKAHPDSMNNPKSPKCPDKGCPPGEFGTITLCPGSNSPAQNCYEADRPGNLFYALIGRYIGWSRLTLQLGSQYAELIDVRPRPTRPAIIWDTPDDTAAIDLGYSLPLPLSRSALCSAIAPAWASLGATTCNDCPEWTRRRIR